jgi:Tfp pilus assembly protein FimT
MNSRTKVVICCLFLAALVAVTSSATPGQTTEDNATVNGLFETAKKELVKIKSDAHEMEAYTRSTHLSWQTHAAKLHQMKEDVNELSSSIEGMKSQRRTASQWQQNAIDTISPLMADLVANMNAAINTLNETKQRPTSQPYKDYLQANVRIVTDLSDEINDALDYAKSKATMERLQEQLDKSQ